MSYSCPLHNWFSHESPCPACHVTITISESGLSPHEEFLESIVDKVMSAGSTLERIGVLRKHLPDPPDSIEQQAEAFVQKINPFIPPKNKEGEEIEQRVGQRAPGSGKHRRENEKIKAAYIAGASSNSVHESVKGGMRWESADVAPKKEGYYVTESEWIGDNHLAPNDRSDTYFGNGKWQRRVNWKIIRWLDESGSEPTGDVMILVDGLKNIIEALGTVNFSSHNQMKEGIQGGLELAETSLSSYQSKKL